ncbi:MAG TPA: hypothetical protein DCP10_01140 [Bacteroidales bacterium]|nr:hypothetical protein [Bacteroidales bacterium]
MSFGRYYCILLIIILMTSSLDIKAQRGQLSTSSSKAEKAYYKATECLDQRNYKCAEKELRKAVSADEGFSEAWMVLAEVLVDQNNIDEAIKVYQTVLIKGRRFYPEALYFLGTLELSTGLYEEASRHLKDFLNSQPISKTQEETAQTKLASCEFALQALQHPVPFVLNNLGPAVNSEYSEYFPCLTIDNQTLLFTRRLPDAEVEGREQEDFFISKKQNGNWGIAENIGLPINTRYNEGAPTLSPDGNFLIFTACSNQLGYGEGREGYGSCDLFISRKMGQHWDWPENIGFPVNTSKWETQPSFSSDGKTLFFIRGFYDKQNTYHQDIYQTILLEDGSWSEPEKLPDCINSPGIEESVFIHPDGQTLYFSSDGWPGMGGLDIFVSRKDSSGQWSTPTNMGYPINTFHDENSLMVSADGKLGYFATDRPGGYGKLDLYSFEIPLELRPRIITYFKGTVFDEADGKKLSAKFELIDLVTGQTIIQSESDPVDGSFLVALPSGKRYALNVSHPDYLFYSDHFDLESNHDYEHPFLKDIPMLAIKVGESVVLRNVFFATDSYELMPESQAELDRLANLLLKNPNMQIEIAGHTDNQGNDYYNFELSIKRAKAVYDYLLNKRIEPQRLTYKGYGETQPVDTNDTPEGRAKNRRTEFKIIHL